MPILLITATVTPPAGATKLARSHPAERLEDYRKAMVFYLDLLQADAFEGIVFADNSDSDVSALHELVSASPYATRVEFLRYYGLDYPPSHGRGYGEMRLIESAMNRSKLIASASPSTMIWKVTGRYVVRNLPALVRRGERADLYIQCRDFPRRWVDMYVFAWMKGAYETSLAGAADAVREDTAGGGSAEDRFRDFVDQLAARRPVLRRFREPPQVEGVRGFDNQRYETQRLKMLARRVLGRLVPWLWV